MVIQSKANSASGSDNLNNDDSDFSENSANMKSKAESATNVLNALKKRKMQSMVNDGANSLELLRENLQYFFNEKVAILMKDFMNTFFDPAIRNIKENTNETITEQQVQIICRNLLETCVKSQYSSSNESMSSPSSSSLSRNTPEMNTSDSDTSENGGTSLLHQALKRKRTDSETEQLFKRQFFLTTAPPNHYFNTTVTSISQQTPGKPIFRPTTSVLTSPSKFITRPIQSSGIFNQTGNTTRPIFHIIQAPNRNLKLSATHVELCQLLKQNNSISSISTSAATASTISVTTVTPTQTTQVKKEPESKN